jgi:hypothetical protein
MCFFHLLPNTMTGIPKTNLDKWHYRLLRIPNESIHTQGLLCFLQTPNEGETGKFHERVERSGSLDGWFTTKGTSTDFVKHEDGQCNSQ